MSHLSTITLIINDLDALAQAAMDCQMTLHRDVDQFAWYAGARGKCSHVLRLADGTASDVVQRTGQHEIGVVANPDGAGFQLTWDPYGQTRLKSVVGQDCNTLRQRYTYHVTRAQAAREGWAVIGERVLEDGSIQMEMTG